MVRKTYTHEQIINKEREAEVYLSQGATVGGTSKRIGVAEQTYYRWRKEYGGMRIDQARRLKELLPSPRCQCTWWVPKNQDN